jgi:hypothetical protein
MASGDKVTEIRGFSVALRGCTDGRDTISIAHPDGLGRDNELKRRGRPWEG